MPETPLTPASPPHTEPTPLEPDMSEPQVLARVQSPSPPQIEQPAEQPSSTPEGQDSLPQPEPLPAAEVGETRSAEETTPETIAEVPTPQPPAGVEVPEAALQEAADAQANPTEAAAEDVFASDASDRPTTDPTTQSTTPLVEAEAPPPPPAPPVEVEEPKPEIPSWVTNEEDTSVPDEEELKEIEAGNDDFSALDFKHHEKYFFPELDDPEHRPVKRYRLNWTIKGVRGTKEKPNYARVMNSPPAYIDGLYWHIKFFPRGNNSSAISAYIKCSKTPPPPDPETPESVFKVFWGPSDADLSNAEPKTVQNIPATSHKPKKGRKSSVATAQASDGDAKKSDPESSGEVQREEPPKLDVVERTSTPVQEEDWRISAQLGMILYNPEEPRTGHWSSSEHQFNKHNDDWGWTNFSGPWNEIHRRRRGQRAALLRNDTLALDAYIQIFDDPTQALWWHPAPDSESQWDSKSLAGYFPMGTPPLYHSPGVAGLTALLLLAPFRKIIQEVDTSLWRKDSTIKPQPLLCHLQQVLFLMRSMKKEETYVNVNHVLESLDNFGEIYWDVKTFWEALRRSVELELKGNDSAIKQIAEIFDGKGKPDLALASPETLKIPVKGVVDVQKGLEEVLRLDDPKPTFPNFLPIMLNRQKFDEDTREWRILYDRVRLNEEIDLSAYCSNAEPSKYTLYGFMVHVGERTSGKFYSVLRPNGPGTKWLAFEDGDGNKVFSYTKRRIEKFEGLEGEELKNSKVTHQTAYMAMYVRTSCLKDYLPGALEPYDMADWLKSNLTTQWHGSDVELTSLNKEEPETQIEVYTSSSVKARHGLLDMFNLKDIKRDGDEFHQLTVPSTTTYAEVRRKLAESLKIDQVEKLRFWIMNYTPLGEYMTASMVRIDLLDEVALEPKDPRPLCLWMEIIESDDDVKLYGCPDPSLEEVKARKEEPEEDQRILVVPRDGDDVTAPPNESQETPADQAQSTGADETPRESESQEPGSDAAAATATDDPAPASTEAAEEPATAEEASGETEATVAAPDAVQASVEEAVQNDVGDPCEPETAAPASSETALEPATEAEAAETETEAGPDALQTSIENAVRDDVVASSTAMDESSATVPNVEAESHQEPAVETSAAIQEPVVETSAAIQEPAVQTSTAIQEPAVETSTTIQEPAVETSTAIQEPAVETSAAIQEPAVETRAAIQEPPAPQLTQESEAPPSQVTIGSNEVPVEHGHLVDAVNVQDPQAAVSDAVSTAAPETAAAQTDVIDNEQAASEALIASIIAADVAAIEAAASENDSASVDEEPAAAHPVESTDPTIITADERADQQSTEQDDVAVRAEDEHVPTPSRPVKHVYGFIQIFDVEQQDFVVHGSFFAELNSDVKTTVRKCLGYAEDKDILVWQRIKAYNTSPISSSTTFSDINFRDGVDVIVGDVLSDEKKDALLTEGKFVTPSTLSRVIWLTERKHPIQAFTGTAILNDFGAGYYSGPLVKGRYHGENGVWITANGHSYKGPFVADEKSGAMGMMTYQNGDVYEGAWLKDEKHGQGTLVEKRTGNKYVGGFENGKRWGEGVTYWKVADEQSDMCQICYSEEIDALFYDCGHVCACVDCAKQCEACPICRKPIVKVVKMYKA